MLPICTWTVRIGQVLTLGVDMMNLLLSFCSALLLRVGSKGHKGLSLLPERCPCFFGAWGLPPGEHNTKAA